MSVTKRSKDTGTVAALGRRGHRPAQCPESPTGRHWDLLPETGLGSGISRQIGVCRYCGRKRLYHLVESDQGVWLHGRRRPS